MGIHLLPPLYEVVMEPEYGIPYIAYFYPDAHPETNSVDGWARHNDGAGLDWSVIRAAAGTDANDSSNNGSPAIQTHGATTDKFVNIARVLLLFDTASLVDNAKIEHVELNIYIDAKQKYSPADPSISVYSSNPASNTALVAGDYATFGSTRLAEIKAYDDITINSWQTFTLNAAGRTQVSKTGVTKLGIREASYDGPNSAPPWVGNSTMSFSIRMADQGTGWRPRLAVTYRIPI
jgi:hypothetical protein